jgi:P4 family phage/plasmid primase-like protien
MNAPQLPQRPGISTATLGAAGIRLSDTPEPGSLEIPYHDLHGNPSGFSRWRLPSERSNGQKYHQGADTGTRAYVPPQFHSFASGGDMGIVEGEFKALSLIEAGVKAIGLPNFNTYVRDQSGETRLVDGVANAIAYTKPTRILFLGDSDTATNFAFARNALFLANALKPLPLLLPRIPVGGPGKGIDDCREALGGKFPEFWHTLTESAEEIDPKASSGALAVRLLERETEAIMASVGTGRDKLDRRIVRMAAECKEPLAGDRIVDFAEKVFGYTRSAFKQAVREARNASITGSSGTAQQWGPSSAMTPNQWFARRFPGLPAEYGDAVLEETDRSGVVSAKDIGEDFVAATLGEKGDPDSPTVYLPAEEKFYTYTPAEGVFVYQREAALLAQMSRLLLQCARDCRADCNTTALEFRIRDAASLGGVLRKGRGLLAVPYDYFTTNLTEYIACANGMLRLRDRALLPFSPSYRRRNKLVVKFDPTAQCPLFLDTLMRPALDDESLDLLQRWCGLVLTGENLAQRILILTGTAGGGKGTFIRVLSGIIGQFNLASLRPHLLGERFELGRFLGKTLLYGADVPENFLNQCGASVLKSLTGHDPVTLEFKNSNESPLIVGRLNVVVTCNSRLTVHLEGDTEAWRRRLTIIEYFKSKPDGIIADLDQQILRTEASGVLNWMLGGLDKIQVDGWQLRLTASQQSAVDRLLLESDSHSVFLRESLRRDADERVTVSECFAAYLQFCARHGWNALPKNKFGALISDVVARQFGIVLRHDIVGASGKMQRGWLGLKLIQPTNKMASEVSEVAASDSSDSISQVQPSNPSVGGVSLAPDREEVMLL